MIELKGVKKIYKSKKGISTEALKGINLELSEKGLTFILGKSGSGKSTLLNILGGIDTCSEGDMFVDGKSTKDFKQVDFDAYRNTYIGFIFQEFNLIDNYTVEQNIKLSLELQKQKVNEDVIMKSLYEVGLENVLKRKPNELSGGQKQRVAIARALIKKPKVILADEPTGNLDSTTSAAIFNIFKSLSKDKLVIIVSHDEEAAKVYADRIIRICDGKLESDVGEKSISSNQEFKLKKAKLPFSYKLKMGISNLFQKKIKLIFASLSLLFCFLCFGLTISMYHTDYEDNLYQKFQNEGGTEVSIYQYKNNVVWKDVASNLLNGRGIETFEDAIPMPISTTESILDEAYNKTGYEWYPSYQINVDGWPSIGESDNDKPIYYNLSGNLDFTSSNYVNKTSLIGSVTSNKDNIIISSYIADFIIYNGVKAKNSITEYAEEYIYKPTSYEDIVNSSVYIKVNNLGYFNVTGIEKVNTSKYESLKNISNNSLEDMSESDEKAVEFKILRKYLTNENNYLRIYISPELITEYKNNVKYLTSSSLNEYVKYKGERFSYGDTGIKYGYLGEETVVYNGKGSSVLSNLEPLEVVINTRLLDDITRDDYKEKLAEYLLFHEGTEETDFLNIYLSNNQIINSTYTSNVANNKVYLADNNSIDYKIVGVVQDFSKTGVVYYPKDDVSDLVTETVSLNRIYRYVENINELQDILKYYPLDNGKELLGCIYTQDILDSTLGSTFYKMIGKYGTIIFTVLAFIFLTNFIFTSIKFRKKEIGIFRALGCSSKDIIEIFNCECLILTSFCLILASFILPFLCSKINWLIKIYIEMEYSLVHFNIVSVVYIIIGVLVLTLLVSSLSLIKIVKQKPIDTILDK